METQNKPQAKELRLLKDSGEMGLAQSCKQRRVLPGYLASTTQMCASWSWVKGKTQFIKQLFRLHDPRPTSYLHRCHMALGAILAEISHLDVVCSLHLTPRGGRGQPWERIPLTQTELNTSTLKPGTFLGASVLDSSTSTAPSCVQWQWVSLRGQRGRRRKAHCAVFACKRTGSQGCVDAAPQLKQFGI
ncbi:hypothetical protein TREES_T100013238 [Tupaia chinensis]|uniref:Uncharacterized protein n=1 Tax=Tupaia chinensis TaxID=246437 RepID=L9KNA5_TUPCH|nr:hypothetical protein TREES_T100013238 [Tupaia chinensis]